MSKELIDLFYLVAAVLFIFGLKGLSHPRTAVRGNLFAALGMLLAIVVTLLDRRIVSFEVIIAGIVVGALIGVIMAYKAPMTAIPQVVAIFNGFGGVCKRGGTLVITSKPTKRASTNIVKAATKTSIRYYSFLPLMVMRRISLHNLSLMSDERVPNDPVF